MRPRARSKAVSNRLWATSSFSYHQAAERLAEALKRLVGVVPDIPPGEIFLRSCLFAGVLW
jgi:hypothetical protein